MSTGEKEMKIPYDGSAWGVRHIQAALMFFLLVVGYGSRMQLSVAIVAMTDNSTSPNPDIPTYDWTDKSIILSSFYWGYLSLQIFAGALSERISTKKYLLITVAINSATCLLAPLAAAKLGSTGLMICRICQGISQGGFFPSVYVLLGRWAPLKERARMSAIALGGGSIANTLTLPLVGYMCSTWMGWPSTYYLYGVFNIIWWGLFFMFGSDSPSQHPSISYEEREYIETSLNISNEEKKDNLIPFKPVLTSIPFWALTLNNVALSWGSLTLANETPNYMSKVMKYDISSDGVLSSLPSLVAFFTSFIFATLADYAIIKRVMSRTVTRKVFTMFGNIGSSVPILILAFLPVDAKVWGITMFVLSHALGSANTGGAMVNHIDLSPKFSGFIMSITNTLGVAAGLTGPLLVQFVVKDEADKSQWTTIFVSSSVLSLSFLIVYILFASGDLQWWNFYGNNIKTLEDFEKLENENAEKSPKKESDFEKIENENAEKSPKKESDFV